jgi:rod shape-determining protein MreC
MPAFVARHGPFFFLLAVLIAQLLLLSFQITRDHKVRLIQVWTVGALSPFERSWHWVSQGAAHTWQSYAGLWQAQEENRRLHTELTAAHARIRQFAGQAEENARLRGLLDLKNQLPFQSVVAEVIAASPGERTSAVFIGKGSDDGLAADLPVMTPAGVVGKIIAVFPHSAQVLLITDPASGVGCMLERTHVQGVLKGGSGSLPQLEYILKDQPVSVGERVLTSGLDQIFPKDLPVGTVAEVRRGSVYKEILVKPDAALDRLESVLVLTRAAAPTPPAPAHRP